MAPKTAHSMHQPPLHNTDCVSGLLCTRWTFLDTYRTPTHTTPTLNRKRKQAGGPNTNNTSTSITGIFGNIYMSNIQALTKICDWYKLNRSYDYIYNTKYRYYLYQQNLRVIPLGKVRCTCTCTVSVWCNLRCRVQNFYLPASIQQCTL